MILSKQKIDIAMANECMTSNELQGILATGKDDRCSD